MSGLPLALVGLHEHAPRRLDLERTYAVDVPIVNMTMETYYQAINTSLPQFGATCMQCHFAAAQRDFSWTLASRAWPPTLATRPKTSEP